MVVRENVDLQASVEVVDGNGGEGMAAVLLVIWEKERKKGLGCYYPLKGTPPIVDNPPTKHHLSKASRLANCANLDIKPFTRENLGGIPGQATVPGHLLQHLI